MEHVTFSRLKYFIVALFFLGVAQLNQAQTIVSSDDFENYQGFGNIPTLYGGGMRVYSTHGNSVSKGLCINFNPFISKDSTITPASPVLTSGCAFHFEYRFATYIGSVAGTPYDLNTDALEIYAAVAGSSSFGTPLLVINANNHISSLDFVDQFIDLSSFEGQSVQIKIKGIRGTGSEFWLDTDNFRIESPNVTLTAAKPATETLNIYPNPANDLVTIELNAFSAPVKVEILNSLGIPVYKRTLTGLSTQLNLEELPKGIYYIRITGAGKNRLEKLVLR